MKAARVAGRRLVFTDDAPPPDVARGWALAHVNVTGICGTDLALARGLYGFQGVPGHEFVATIASGPTAWRSRRVVAHINVACGRCARCRRGLRKHCEQRRVIGIRGLDGSFAEYVALPVRNLVAVPDRLDDEAAVFAEPLAAAIEASRRLPPEAPVLVVGPGRLGQLVIRVLLAQQRRVFAVGRSEQTLAALPARVEAAQSLPASWCARFDAVVDCSGSAEGARTALAAARPRGTVVLKGTPDRPTTIDLGRAVVDEIRIVGSRCGNIGEAVDWLTKGLVDPRPLVSAAFALEAVRRGFSRAAEPGIMKVLLRP